MSAQEAAELKHHPEEQQQEDADQSSSEGKVSNLRRIRVKIMVIHSGTASTDKDRTVMEHSPLLKIRRPAGTSHLRNTIVNRTLCNSRRVTEKLSNSDGRRQVARIRDFILCTLAIISNDHLQSRKSTSTRTNWRNNTQGCHNTITLHLIIQVSIRCIKRHIDSSSDSKGGSRGVSIERGAGQDITIDGIGWERQRHNLLDGDADADSASTRRSRRRTRAAAAVAEYAP